MIKFGIPNITNKELEATNKVLKSRWLTTGQVVNNFEKKFKNYKNSNFAIGVTSCTDALYMSLLALNLKNGDEVITSAMTFCSAVNVIENIGAKPVLVDIKKDTLNIDPDIIEKKITKKTKAIIIVHFAGMPCEMEKILKITNKYNIKLIEDCAHSIETKYKGLHVGNFGFTGCFSFYANKNITTAGEGGMIVCNNKKLDTYFKKLRLHGMSKEAWSRFDIKKNYHNYDLDFSGLKNNMTNVQASMGIVQLKKIEKLWKLRKKIYQKYQKFFEKYDVGIQLPIDGFKNYKHGYHLFVLYFENTRKLSIRNKLIKFLKKNQIGFGIHYRPINDLKFYKKKYNWNKKTAPIAFNVGSNIISLPLHPDLTDKEQKYILSKFKNFFSSLKLNPVKK
ncbi:DegT/DnrJ/EryC1/StrS aminotransferase family protein [Candidatus Pelagibacter bacterium]|jgi:dTDP-4-amino-4,6-dideoxygalactose transaminase|nr:DegT/DnrJ/EryC1/StrS aminotransferase family protein [Candidatus Pelagibacter bacterium]